MTGPSAVLLWTVQANVLESVGQLDPGDGPAPNPGAYGGRRYTQVMDRRPGRLTIAENLDDGLGGRAPRVMWRSDDGTENAQVAVPDATVDDQGHWDEVDRARWMAWAGFKLEEELTVNPGSRHGGRTMVARASCGVLFRS